MIHPDIEKQLKHHSIREAYSLSFSAGIIGNILKGRRSIVIYSDKKVAQSFRSMSELPGPEKSSDAPPPPPPPGQLLKDDETLKYLSDCGWPVGLQKALIAGLIRTPARFFICDNSTSMTKIDGHWVVAEGDQTKYVSKYERKFLFQLHE
jgi:hypothetical protein